MKIFKQNNKGFTLIETMIAVFILSMALTALLGLISSSLFYARYSRNEITANYLLQEVVDSIKNERSSSILRGTGWQGFVNKYSSCDSDGCDINAKIGDVREICSNLKYDDNATDGSFYNCDKGTDTTFKREVIITSNGDELKIIVTVYWKNGSVNKERSLSSSILNWQ